MGAARHRFYDREALGARLREARRAKGLTQKIVAERLGVTVRTISNHETGNTSPAYEYLSDYRRMYCITLDWLILGLSPAPVVLGMAA